MKNEPQQHEPGLYSFDGKVFTKLEASEGKKAPVDESAYNTLLHFRREFQTANGVRLDLKIVASAIIGFVEIAALNGQEGELMQFIRERARSDFQDKANKL